MLLSGSPDPRFVVVLLAALPMSALVACAEGTDTDAVSATTASGSVSGSGGAASGSGGAASGSGGAAASGSGGAAASGSGGAAATSSSSSGGNVDPTSLCPDFCAKLPSCFGSAPADCIATCTKEFADCTQADVTTVKNCIAGACNGFQTCLAAAPCIANGT